MLVSAPTVATTRLAPSEVVPGLRVDSRTRPQSGRSMPGWPQPRGSRASDTMSASSGWPPPGLRRASASSASLGAASTIGEVATGVAGTASTRALSGRARTRFSDVVDSGIHTSGGEPAPGKGTGCSACCAWSRVSDRT